MRYVITGALGTVLLLVGCGGQKSNRAAIAFSSRDYRLPPAIFRVYSNGCCRKQLTHPHNGARDFSPTWSPDGQRVAFIRQYEPTERLRLFIADGKGETLVPIKDHKIDGAELSWSPDGRQILFSAGDGLRSIDLSDGKTALIDSGGSPLDAGAAGEGSWSPDGHTIAFARIDGIFLADPDGSQARRLTRVRDPVNNPFFDSDPSWSPDGKQLAYIQVTSANFSTFRPRIRVINADGTGARTVATVSPLTSTTPTWSPAGRQIAFSDFDRSAPGIYAVPASGGKRRLLFKGETAETSWSRP